MEIFPFDIPNLARQAQEQRLNQMAKVIWFTGLSGSGKSTLAIHLSNKILESGMIVQILDGDNIRNGINADLKFSEKDRQENIRRIAEIAKLFLEMGIIVICCTISPKDSYRDLARDILGKDDLIEYFVSTPIEVCEKRDTKGLYAKARSGELQNFSGINAEFEKPDCNQIIYLTNTNQNDLKNNVIAIWQNIYDQTKFPNR